MAMPKPLLRIMRIKIGIRELMMLPVKRSPFERRLFIGCSPKKQKQKLDYGTSFKSRMRKKAMIPHGNRKTCRKKIKSKQELNLA